MERNKIVCVLILLGSKIVFTEEPMCLSRFDFEYKMLNKIIELEQKLKENEKRTEQQQKLIDRLSTDELEQRLKENEKRIEEQQKLIQTLSTDGKGAVFVRWGRNDCPDDNTQVYNGYIGGKHYTHSGSGSDSLCLPSDPSWLNYTDGINGNKAYVYGAEIALDDDKDKLLFENRPDSQDMPCSVCKTMKSTVFMIPARNACYSGWKLEYRGYLVAQHFTHSGPGIHICLDSRPDFMPNGERRLNQHLFYKVEPLCGTLPCPPYVEGRELACVVCSS